MKRKFLTTLIVIFAIIVTGCLASCAVAELVAGKTFVFDEALSVSYDDTVSDEQKESVTVESINTQFSDFTIEFGEDGTVSGSLFNGVVGSYEQDGSNLSITAGGMEFTASVKSSDRIELTISNSGIEAVLVFVESTETQDDGEQSIVGTFEIHHIINRDNITGEQIFRFDIGDTLEGVVISKDVITLVVNEDGTAALKGNAGEQIFVMDYNWEELSDGYAFERDAGEGFVEINMVAWSEGYLTMELSGDPMGETTTVVYFTKAE